MKLTGLIFAVLYLHASTSLLDEFRGAMSNVERGFGKLLTDVVTDVKDTVRCTMSAVEQVLVLNGLLDKTSTYSYKCQDTSKPIPKPALNARDHKSLFDIFHWKYPNHNLAHQKSPRHVSTEIRKSINNVNRTVNEILGNRQSTSNFNFASKIMKEDTNRLTEISEILKQEIENMSSNIRLKIKKLGSGRKKSTINTVWDNIKILHDIQHNSKNATEISEVRNILDKVVDKLHLNSDSHKVSDTYNLKEMKKKLQAYSAYNDTHILKGNEAHSELQEFSFKKSKTKIASNTFKGVTEKILNTEKNSNKNPSITGKSLFNLNLDLFHYITPFSKADTNSKKNIDDARKIVEDSKHTDKILNKFFNEHRGVDVFSNPELFDLGKS